MGLRGKHARPAKAAHVRDSAPKRPSWKRPGLSRPQRVIRFLESLPVTKGVRVGKKMKLLPGQVEFINNVYGRAGVRIAIKSEPRGNGKTGLVAGLALAHLLGPEAEPRGEIYSAAIDKLQAGIIFREMKAIVEAVPDFAARTNIMRFQKTIEVLSGDGEGSIYEALSADDRRAHGLAPSLWIYDEFAQAKNAELLDNLRTAMGKRTRSLGIVISTQAANDQHPLSELIDDALLGTDPSVYVQLRAAPEDADPFAESTWHGCNEALGHFLDLEEFRSQARMAKRLPSFLAKFRNLRLNQRIDAEVRYIADSDWMQCGAPVDAEALKGATCIAGLDLSQTTDMTALVLFFPDTGDVLPFYWLPADGLMARDEKEGTPYRVWRDRGYLETTSGKAINYDAIVLRLAEIAATYNVQAVAYDRAFIKQLQRRLDDMGVQVPLQEFGQGWVSMSPAVQLLEAAVLDRRIRHGGHPILRWNLSNVKIDMDPAGNRKVTKKRAPGHVDGIVSLLMAMGLAAKLPAPVIYDFSGPRVLVA